MTTRGVGWSWGPVGEPAWHEVMRWLAQGIPCLALAAACATPGTKARWWQGTVAVEAGAGFGSAKATLPEAATEQLHGPQEPAKSESEGEKKAATPVPGSNLEPDNHAGRFSFDLLTGVEISQKRDAFSKVTPYLRFVGDTAWRSQESVTKIPAADKDGALRDLWFFDPTNVHTWIDLSLESVPVEGDDTTPGTTDQEFIDSRKSFQGVIGADWRFIGLAPSNARRTSGGTTVVEPYRMFLGPTARIGVQTLDDSQLQNANFETDDRTARHWGVGLKLGDHRLEKVGKDAAGEDIDYLNPGIRRYLAVYYGEYETFRNKKWTVEGMLRTDGKPGLFVGFTAVLGDGEDDITIWVGVTYGIDQLVGLFDGLLP